ncbi:hypothetical protein D3C75_511230 [compost metagenome]
MRKGLVLLSGLIVLVGCHAAPKTAPTQVIYRFDDHRYLELEGFNCEGALWYNDTQRNIRSEVLERDSPIFRISFFRYVHPSEKYISIPWDDLSGLLISKNYGQTWGRARFAPGGGAVQYGASGPESGEVDSFTVVNDQGFIQTKSGHLYMSSKPFDDPRMMPGGSGIDYTYDGEKHHLRPRYNGTDDNSYWGKNYTSWASVQGEHSWKTFAYETNWQNIPNKVPEVKNYTGWDRMKCNPDIGLSTLKQGT